MKRPSIQFYPGDWLRSTNLRACSLAARGLWIDMICLMHDGEPYGYLKVGKKVISDITLATMVGISFKDTKTLLKELEEADVFSRDKAGCVHSRRMVKDEKIRKLRAKAGRKGGNPLLKQKDNQVVNPQDKHFVANADAEEEAIESSFEKEKEALRYLNDTAGKKYRFTETTKVLIAARLKEYSLEEIKQTLSKKIKQWLGTEQEKYIRPETLFKASKFEAYFNEPEFIQSKGKQGIDAEIAALLAKKEQP